MTTKKRARELGMHRDITRRDFINGIAISLLGASTPRVFARAPLPADYYPPSLTGLRGSHAGSFEVAHGLRGGGLHNFPRLDSDTGEAYDLVVVGGGLSGLSAAIFFRESFGDDKKVLILDNHDDFGGHAKRNEFRHDGRLFIGYGGTMGISTPFPYSYAAKTLIEDLGIQVDRYPEFVDEEMFQGLSGGMFFDREHFGEDRLVAGMPGRRGGSPSEWKHFLAKSPLSDAARNDLIRLFDPNAQKDYLPDLTSAQKKARLEKMSYEDYLRLIVRIHPDALPFMRFMSFRNNKFIDTCPALEAAHSGAPGFSALNLEEEPRLDYGRYYFHFPDGNATVARLLVNRLVPDALPGGHDMESVVQARVKYEHLDKSGGDVRIRLNSTVVRAEHEGAPELADWVRVAYVQDGKTKGVRARNVVMACYNSAIPYLMPELADNQKAALAQSAKVPLLYTNVFLRNWKAFEKLGVNSIRAPGMYHEWSSLDQPVSMGGYNCSQSPEEPIIVHLSRVPSTPGLLPRREQLLAGKREMLATSFETMELSIREQFARMLGPGGLDPARDILGITVNRWPHGYAYTPDTLSDPNLPEAKRPHVVGRQPFGRVAIANSDAGAAAYTNTAIDEAHRAVHDLSRTRDPY
jgi:spermidine dehydrogenase